MKKTLGLTVILLLALGSLAWAQDTIKIGVVGPRTGPAHTMKLSASKNSIK